MAGKRTRIQGITIEISGDTTNLQSALKDVDKRLSSTQTALKDINKLLKLNPGNTDLLVQKQKALKSAIDDTKERLKTLKEAYDNSTDPAQQDIIQREIIETENNLKSLETEYRKFGSVGAQKMKAFGSAIQDAGEKIKKVGTGLSTYVTAPLVGLGAAAYAAFNDVDKGMDTIITKTGATGDALDDMGRILKNIATSIPTDFETAGEAIGEVNTRFGLTGQALEDLSTQYIKFAEINGTDVTGAIDSTQKAMAAFGVDVSEASQYLDHLTLVSQQTGVSVDTLAEGTVKNATAFKEMGLNIYGAASFMGMLEVSGADSSAVMSGLAKALKKATDKGIPLDRALSDLQDTILNGTDSTDGLTAAYELFGKNGAQVYEAVRNGTLDFNALSNAADGLSDTVSQTFAGTLSPADRFKTVVNDLKVLGSEIAEIVLPFVEAAIDKVKGVIDKLRDAWGGLTDEQKQSIVTILGVAAAVGPVLVAVGGLVNGFGKVVSVIGTVKAALDGAGGLIGVLKGPVGVVGAIAAVIAAGVYLYQHWDEIKEKALALGEKVKAAFLGMVEKIKSIDWAAVGAWMHDKITSAFITIGTWATGAFNKIVDAIEAIGWADVGAWMWNGITQVFSTIGEWATTTFSAIQTAIEAISWADVGTGVWNAIKKAFSTVSTWATETFNKASAAIKNIDWGSVGTWMWDNITTAFESIGDWASETFDTAVTAIKNIDWAGLGSTLWDWIKRGVNGVVGAAGNVGTWFLDVFNDAWDKIKNIDWGAVGTSLWNAIKGALSGIGEWLIGVFKTPINSVIGMINGMISAVEHGLNSVIRGINSALSISIPSMNLGIFGRFPGFSWSPHLGGVTFGRLQELANGGSLSEGQRAIVGEYEPEYLRVVNGRAIVTPLGTDGQRLGGNNSYTFNVYAQPGQSAQQIAEEVQRIFVQQQRQREAAYA